MGPVYDAIPAGEQSVFKGDSLIQLKQRQVISVPAEED
jgi:hypothetical protein